jgi:hypothetical protein
MEVIGHHVYLLLLSFSNLQLLQTLTILVT